MIRKSDVQWWVLEATKHPESAPAMIEELAKRLVELDAENERLRNEVIALKRRAPASASSDQVQTLQQKVETLQSLLKGQLSSEPALVFLSDQMQVARVPLSWAREQARQGRSILDAQALLELSRLVVAMPNEELLLLSSRGRGFKLQFADIPALEEGGKWPVAKSIELERGERLSAVVSVAEAPRFWTVATRRGYVQRFVRVAFDRELTQGVPVVKSTFHNDEPVDVVEGTRGDLLLVTRMGKAVRFSHYSIETQGSVALEMESGDEVVAALALPGDMEILVLTPSGYAIRRSTAEFPARTKPGGTGKVLIQARAVLAAFPYEAQAHVLYLTQAGRITVIPTADVPLQERSSRGIQLHDLSREPALAVALVRDVG